MHLALSHVSHCLIRSVGNIEPVLAMVPPRDTVVSQLSASYVSMNALLDSNMS